MLHLVYSNLLSVVYVDPLLFVYLYISSDHDYTMKIKSYAYYEAIFYLFIIS